MGRITVCRGGLGAASFLRVREVGDGMIEKFGLESGTVRCWDESI